ncbi:MULTISPECIES: winged helix-turn-helix domain-containing protein [Microbacterium]|uniref:ArsR family transcriptional regulator n=1 Tax=Microbacterium wangchenii TaxID=2541726 RepID=A0ABX5SV08_9MICO|nr:MULTISPECIES: helix-turn-helix domain-containing protein [Microbacterium]MCK6065537.1 helix-turn-helix domain-containing protein [Microbacterium sp. EYE_512]QBR88963.1 ArsR family transcriptional regulator [Microbacterium wangchenii]
MDDGTSGRASREPATRVLDAGALRALAHPLRVQIYDILSQYGPQTSSSLAALTGESSGATSYHLRALARQDLIREVPGRGTARERWWERPIGGVELSAPEAARTPAGRAAMQVVMTETLNRRHQQLMAWVATAMDTEPEQWREGSIISSGTARLTAAQLADLTRRIQTIIDETVDTYRDQQGEDVRPVTIRSDVFPLPPEGA